MIQINLLPGTAARRAPSTARALKMPGLPNVGGDPRVIALGAVAVLLVLYVGFSFWRTSTRMAELETRVAEAREDSVRLQSAIALTESLRARQDTVQRKIEVIASVDQRRYVWPHLLDEVSRAVPQYTWLAKVTALDDGPAPAPAAGDSAAAPPLPEGPRFSLEGNTGSTQALTRLMKNLEASPMIRDVALVTSEQTEVDERTVLRFTLEALYERPDSTQIETVPVLDAS